MHAKVIGIARNTERDEALSALVAALCAAQSITPRDLRPLPADILAALEARGWMLARKVAPQCG